MAKDAAKAKKKTAAAKGAPATGPTTSAASWDPSMPLKAKAGSPPAPFEYPEGKMKPFEDLLDPKHIYIAHIDTHPAKFKKQLFGVPVLMNIAITLLLVYRVYQIAPYYFKLVMTVWGYQTEYYIDVKNAEWSVLFDEGFKRTFTFMFDLMLTRFIAAWPWDFLFARPASAAAWRYSLGFRDKEVAVRRSRRWDASLPADWLAQSAQHTQSAQSALQADAPPWTDRIMPAIKRSWISQKSAYMMMDKSWDLDFSVMIASTRLVDTQQLALDDLRTQVWAHSQDYGWLVWPVWKLDEQADGGNEKGRQKIVAFKDKLTAMGKENLFFRWIELVQFESEQPGGFTSERQQRAMSKARELFEEQGVDFDMFWSDVGGMEGMPGLESL